MVEDFVLHPSFVWGLLKKPGRLQRSLFQRTTPHKRALIRAINDCYNCRAPQMYRKLHTGQLSIKDFHVPFGGTLDTGNRWVIFSSLMPWEELVETYPPQFNPTTGTPAKPLRLAFGALFIKQRLGFSDEETVEQIRENAYMQFFLGFDSYSCKTPFDPSMMVHFRKRFSEEGLNRIINSLPHGEKPW